jgi:hypothetical protein
MKTDLYTKTALTLITLCLIGLLADRVHDRLLRKSVSEWSLGQWTHQTPTERPEYTKRGWSCTSIPYNGYNKEVSKMMGTTDPLGMNLNMAEATNFFPIGVFDNSELEAVYYRKMEDNYSGKNIRYCHYGLFSPELQRG